MLWLTSQLKSLSLKAMSTVTICPPSPGSTVSLQVCVCACCKCSHRFLLISVKKGNPARVAVLKLDAKKHWTQVMYSILSVSLRPQVIKMHVPGEDRSGPDVGSIGFQVESRFLQKNRNLGATSKCHQTGLTGYLCLLSMCSSVCTTSAFCDTNVQYPWHTYFFQSGNNHSLSFSPEVLQILDKPVALIPAALPWKETLKGIRS